MTAVTWPEVKIGEYVDLLSGFAFKSKDFTSKNDDIPLVKGENLHQRYIDWKNAKRWPKEEFENHAKYELVKDDVVIAMDRPWIEAGLKYSWIKEGEPRALLVQRVSRLRGANGLSTKFLRYVIGSPAFTGYIKPIVTGVNVPHISGQQIKDFKFKLPPVDVQNNVAEILEQYDSLIENNNRRIAILEKMAQSLYREWFVNFRFPGHENCKFVDSVLGRVPEGWGVVPLSEAMDINRGRSYKSSELAADGEGMPFLNLKNILREGGFRRDGLKWYSGPFKPSNVAKPNDIIMAVTDMTQERAIVARAARVPQMGFEDFVISMDLIKITAKPDYDASFIYSLLRYSEFPHAVKAFANGANVLHLSPKVVADYVAVFPDKETSAMFTSLVFPIHALEDSLAKKNDNLKEQRDMLLPRLVGGQIELGA